MDDTISPGQDADALSQNVELPVNVDTLSIDGIEPTVGDQVKIKVTGIVTRTFNGIAHVRIETLNDMPFEAPAVDPDPMASEGDRLEKLSGSYGAIHG